jgi:hypothetical protein
MADSDGKERLFRDEAGAALERAARLEDENRRLRAEVERLSQGPGGPGEPEFQVPEVDREVDKRLVVGVLAGALGLASLFLAARPHHTHCSAARVVRGTPGIAVAPLPVIAPVEPLRTAPATPVIAPAARPGCDPPYTMSGGVRVYKSECLGEVAIPRLKSGDCSPPYTVNASGHRVYKAECL